MFDRLQKQGVCLSHNDSMYMMEMIDCKFNDSIIELVRQRQRFRLIGDNINWTVGVLDQRFGHKGHMEHAFWSAVLVQNVDFSAFEADAPLRHFKDTPCQQFIPTHEDYALYKYTLLMSWVVLQFVPLLNMFEEVIPERLSKPCDPNLRSKTKVIPLSVLYKKEQKYQDVVQILAFYENVVAEACDAEGRDVNDLFIHIGGDQLTRERFSTAKTLRAHEDNRRDRFENLSPIIFKFFHMHMNFLAMAFKTLYNDRSAQDIGTLKSLQNRISRSNVDSNVNTHYDAEKDFFISVVDVFIVECFMEFFGMENVNDQPTKNIPPIFENTEQKRESGIFGLLGSC